MIHQDIPERDKPAQSYEEATQNTGLSFVKVAMVYAFMCDFPEEEEEDPVEEVADPFFWLDADASPIEHISGSSLDDTLDAYPK